LAIFGEDAADYYYSGFFGLLAILNYCELLLGDFSWDIVSTRSSNSEFIRTIKWLLS